MAAVQRILKGDRDLIRVLFICHGNICRSPMAEFIFKDMISKRGIADRFYVSSAATSTEEIWNGIGNPVYPPAREELAKHGISCKGKRAVQVQKEDYEKYDYILGMDQWNLRNMLRIFKTDPQKKIIDTIIIPLEDRIVIIKKVVIIQLVKKEYYSKNQLKKQ